MTDYKPEDYIKYRIERARETIEEVQTHIEHKFWNIAINRLYCACFYAAGALLAKHKIEVNSHLGVNCIPRSRPMLKYGIQSLNENKIILPSSQKNWPDKDRLAQRFDAFRQVG